MQYAHCQCSPLFNGATAYFALIDMPKGTEHPVLIRYSVLRFGSAPVNRTTNALHEHNGIKIRARERKHREKNEITFAWSWCSAWLWLDAKANKIQFFIVNGVQTLNHPSASHSVSVIIVPFITSMSCFVFLRTNATRLTIDQPEYECAAFIMQ